MEQEAVGDADEIRKNDLWYGYRQGRTMLMADLVALWDNYLGWAAANDYRKRSPTTSYNWDLQ